MTVAEITEALKAADAAGLSVLERALAADDRKGVRAALSAARRRLDAQSAEEDRIRALYDFERSLLPPGGTVVVGLDEVGRGAVAGPLAVGAVVLPAQPAIAGLNDSKKLSPERRRQVARSVRDAAVACAVEYVEPGFIDAHGMTASLRRAFRGALDRVIEAGVRPDAVLVDGNPLHIDEREVNVVKGDEKCASIAAASIVAKVERDALMCALSPEYPAYAFHENKGYASEAHVNAIREQGLSPIHRASFCRSFMQETLF